MKIRSLDQYLLSNPTQDGAGVKLRRLFWREDTLDIDPFLMLDTFDSKDPQDYIKGFPLHPHRGIQTLTYFIKGHVKHLDSLGNSGSIKDGEFQWMNAGGGILHEEMPQPVEHMLGFQLWINLPQKNKMSTPEYYSGTKENIKTVQEQGHTVHIISGSYKDTVADTMPGYLPTQIYDIEIDKNTEFFIPVNPEYNVFMYSMLGSANICGTDVKEKAGATFTNGDAVSIKTSNDAARIFFFSGPRLDEPIAWGGPIVMNTEAELQKAQEDLRNNTFVSHEINIDRL